MSREENANRGPGRSNRRGAAGILALAILSALLYLALASLGDLRARIHILLPVHGVLILIMAGAWWTVRRSTAPTLRLALGAALIFRVVAAFGEPALSDDVYRYVWDGRVQVQGVHPYRHAPDDPTLVELREIDWESINHKEVHTIYPPLSQMLFAALTIVGAGVRGFKLAAGLLDFGVVLALAYLLRALSLPRDRVILYAWNPLAILETAGSGHVEPAGVALVVLAAAWTVADRPFLSAAGLAGSVHIKLLPIVLVPGQLRRWPVRATLVFLAVVVALALPYALTGPAVGGGLFDYAGRWQRNGFFFPAILRAFETMDLTPWLKETIASLQSRWGEGALPWDWLYRHVWPPYLARATAATLAVAWIAAVALRRRLDAARESLLVLGGVLLLSPTLHPWYVLWILPFAAALCSRGWLLLAALVPLAYLGGDGDVPRWARGVEFIPAVSLMAWDTFRSRLSRRGSIRS